MMKSNFILASVAALFCSCAVPFIERAQDPPGVSYCLGAGSNTDLDAARMLSDNPPYAAWNTSATGAVHKALSRVSSISLQADYSQTLPVFDTDYWIQNRPAVSAYLGYKHSVGRGGALKGEIGVGCASDISSRVYPLLSIAYLRDLGDHFTGRARLGTDLLALDLNCHAPLANSAMWYVNLGIRELPSSPFYWGRPFYSTVLFPGITLGFGIEFGQEKERTKAR